MGSRKAKDHAEWKKICHGLASLSRLDPEAEVYCSENANLHSIMKDFLNSNCLTCGKEYGSKNRLESHNKGSHSKQTVCSCCMQVVINSKRHILQIPKSFHHIFLASSSSSQPSASTAFQPSTEQPAPQASILSCAKNRSIKNIHIPNSMVGIVIGRGGVKINEIQTKSGARIDIAKDHDVQANSLIRAVQIQGTSEQIVKAEELIGETVAQTRSRNTSGGGYRAPRPQSNTWPPPPSQPSYNNYMQPSACPGAPQSQYNMPQPQYQGYLPYQTGWDQSANQSAQQQQPALGGYDYYNQQQHQAPQPAQSQPTGASSVPPASTDSSGYSYAQPLSYTSQGSYGDASAYSSSYSQGYSQPQAGYNYGSATSYATLPTKTSSQDGSEPNYSTPGGGTTTNSTPPQASPAPQTPTSGAPPSQQGYPSQPSMTAPPSYPTQGYPPVPPQPGYSSGQPGYGQTGYGQKPPPPQPAYGQVQPTGSAQTSYAQAAYGQAAPPQLAYGTGYGAYGQYNESYGGVGGYGQVPAPAYAKDGASGPGTGSGALGGVALAAPAAAGSKTPPS